jgi:hypothetical protein
LITVIEKPRARKPVEMWALYPRSESLVVVQHRLLFSEDWPGRFDEVNPDRYVCEFDAVDKYGEKLPTWSTTVDDIKSCLTELRRESQAYSAPH